VLFGLFFYPHIVLPAVHRRVRFRQALGAAMAICLICGFCLGLARLPRTLKVSGEWASWLAHELGAVWLDGDGALRWERPAKLPYTTRHRGWRLDFVQAGTRFPLADEGAPAAAELGPETRGIWIGPEQVLLWRRPVGDEAFAVPLVADKKIAGLIEMTTIWPGGGRFEGSQFAARIRRLVFKCLPFALLREMASVCLAVFVYVLMFSVMTVFLHGPFSGDGLAPVLVIHLYASIPPVIVASIYAGLNLPHLDLGTVFLCAFVLYLVLMFSAMRRLSRDGEDGACGA